jgi:hypothetical protein
VAAKGPPKVLKSVSIRSFGLSEADPLNELLLLQERRYLQDEFEALGSGADISSTEAEFVKIALAYSNRRYISYATWR